MELDCIDIRPFLEPFAWRLKTQQVRIERGLLDQVVPILSDLLPAGVWLLPCDENTWAAAGAKVETALRQAGLPSRFHMIEPHRPGTEVVADGDSVRGLEEQLRVAGDIRAVVAVGSGTVSDIAKLASYRAGLPYAVIGTAPSMNGYTSGVAAIVDQGVKVTVPCHQPVACLLDMDVMAAAPYRLLAAGLGDLLSRSVSMADWTLSHRLTDTE